MASQSGKKRFLKDHDRPPTLAEIRVLSAIHDQTKRVVLAPTLVNGEKRYALALLCQDPAGELYLNLLAFIPSDEEVLDTSSEQDYNQITSLKKVLH